MPLPEFLWTFTWNVLTILLTYLFLYYYFYPEYLMPFSEQIPLIMACLAIIWCFLTFISDTLIRQYLFCATCVDIVIHQATYEPVKQLFDRTTENEIVLQGKEITVELERYIQKGLLKIRRNQSLSKIGEEDKVRLYFEPPFGEIIQNREEILEKGFFFEKYFDDTSFI